MCATAEKLLMMKLLLLWRHGPHHGFDHRVANDTAIDTREREREREREGGREGGREKVDGGTSDEVGGEANTKREHHETSNHV